MTNVTAINVVPVFAEVGTGHFSCHLADACASLLLLVTVHLAAVPSPPGVEPAP